MGLGTWVQNTKVVRAMLAAGRCKQPLYPCISLVSLFQAQGPGCAHPQADQSEQASLLPCPLWTQVREVRGAVLSTSWAMACACSCACACVCVCVCLNWQLKRAQQASARGICISYPVLTPRPSARAADPLSREPSWLCAP